MRKALSHLVIYTALGCSALCFSSFFSQNVFAADGGAWSDDGGAIDVSSGGTEDCSVESSGTWGNCVGIGWLYYQYKKGSGEQAPYGGHGTVTIPKAQSSRITVSGNTIPSKCGKYGGFYNLGYVVNRRWRDGSMMKAKPVDEPYFQLGSFTYNGNEWRNDYPRNPNKVVSVDKYANLKTTDGTKIWAISWMGQNKAMEKFTEMVVNYGNDIGINPNASEEKIEEEFYRTGSFCYGDPDKKGVFRSKSAVKSEKSENGEETLNQKYDEEGEAKPYRIKIPASQESTQLTFSHRIRIVADDEKFEKFKKADAYTKYTVKQTGYDEKTIENNTRLSVNDDFRTMPNGVTRNKKVAENTTTVMMKDLEINKPVKICQRITYRTKTFKISANNDKFNPENDEAYSQICIEVEKVDDGKPNSAAFYSKSAVSHAPSSTSEITGKDEKKATPVKDIKVSTASQTVTFNHVIGARMTQSDYDKAKGFGASTEWKVTQTSSNDSLVSSDVPRDRRRVMLTDLSTTSNEQTREFTKSVVSIPVNVAVPNSSRPEDGITICQKIEYNTKNFSFATKFDPANDSGSSSICVRLYGNVDPPGGGDPPGNETPKFTSCPLSGSDHSQYHGNTLAETKVKNYNNSGLDWSDTVLAKPGDEIQFRHTLCNGAQAVKGSKSQVGDDRQAIANLSTSQLTQVSSYYLSESDFPENTFSLSAERNNKYLFNRADLTSEQHIPKGAVLNSRAYTNQSTEAERKLKEFYNRLKPEEIFTDYGFRIYSPKNANAGGATSYNNNPFNCSPFGANDWASGQQANAYRIPGFDLNDNLGTFLRFCNSAVKNWKPNGETVYTSDVGSKISQTLTFKDLKTWIGHRHDRDTTTCGRDTNNPTNNSALYYYSSAVGNSSGWGYVDDGDCVYDHLETIPHTECFDGSCYTWYEYHDWWKKVYPESPARRAPSSGTYYDVRYEARNDSRTATVKVPYNFNTSADAKITTGQSSGVVFAGETADSEFDYAVLARENRKVSPNDDKYLTITPESTIVRFVQFTLGPNVSVDEANQHIKGGVSPSSSYDSPCDYYERYLGASHCENIRDDINGPLNKRGYLKDSNTLGATKYREQIKDRIIPDVEVGSKYCVAMGISHADSHGLPDQTIPNTEGAAANDLSMGDTNPRWRISNASCRTIAKKPNFETWGGFYTNGKLKTSQSPKSAIDRIFGSWSDTLAIANGTIEGYASGATIGYNNNGGGAVKTNTAYCKLVPMTIANKQCTESNQVSGEAIAVSSMSNEGLLNHILSRYKAIEIEGDTSTGALVQNKGDGTKVIKVSGTLTIDHNVCLGEGTCNSESSELKLGSRNTTAYQGIEQLPQIILAADNVKIAPNVTQVDAWIFAKDNIDTCYDAGHNAHANADRCSKTLIFNGPVFAKTLSLNRTAGAYPGPNALGTITVDRDLASGQHRADTNGNPTVVQYGSLTPAEIFNLRPDVYYWGYNQSNRLTQATTVYMREIAPRF